MTPSLPLTDRLRAPRALPSGVDGGGTPGQTGRARRNPRVQFLVRRLAHSAVTILAASLLLWLLTAASPGDPAQKVLAARGIDNPTRPQLAAMRRSLGLDHGVLERYWHWLVGAVHWHFGVSYISGRSVNSELATHLEATCRLAGTALGIVVIASILLATIAGLYAGRFVDFIVKSVTVSAASIPPFVVGLFLIQFVITRFGVGQVVTNGTLGEVLFPAVCIAIGSVALPTRVLRSAMIASLDEQYSTVARARGASRLWLLARHGLPNALIPFVNALALSAGYMISGAVVVEAVFSWPGVGSYLVQAVEQHDIPVIQAAAVLATIAYVAASLLADFVAQFADPRVAEGVRS